MIYRLIFISFSFLFFFTQLEAQSALVKGRITDNFGKNATFVNVTIPKYNKGTTSDEDGYYEIKVPANIDVIIEVSGINYDKQVFQVNLTDGQIYVKNINIKVSEGREVTIKGEKEDKTRTLISTEELKLKETEIIPNANGGIETYLQALGAQSNNELSSSYSVRGGNFDENLVYVNDFEVYRPFLIRSGQQEGLSFVNPDMTDKLTFSTGGFQAKYGDKMSSVLDVKYRRPTEFSGSVTGSLFGANIHLEGTNKKTRRFSYSTGFRYKTSKFLLNSQDTQGQYLPTFIDFQGFFTYQINDKVHFEYLINYAKNRFQFTPEDRTTDFGLVNFQTRFNVYYEGQEDDAYESIMNGISLVQKVNNNLELKYLAGAYVMQENERFDIIGDYFLGEVETDITSEDVGEIKTELGSGTFHDWARNELRTTVIQNAFKGSFQIKKHDMKFGFTYKREIINDQLSEWERRDSTGYSMPSSETEVLLYDVLKAEPFELKSNRYSAYVQDTWTIDDSSRVSWNYGGRIQYWDVNKEWLFSPRMQLSYAPKTKNDIILTAAGGLYMQPPFYREMRNLDGEINLDLKAQKSAHLVAGLNYAFSAWDRPFKFVTEAYYKYIWDGVPYEFDNVLIRYFGENNSKGYVVGVDFRLHGELAKGAESWVSLSIMNGQEDILDDFYTEYSVTKTKEDGNGNTVSETLDTTSVTNVFPGYIPRPTDQRVNFALFFQDYIPSFPYIKVHMNLVYGSGLPFGPPDSERYNDIYRIPSYKRFDIGFSASLFDLKMREDNNKHTKAFFQNIEKIWLSLEVYNLFGINNTVSYIWIEGLDPTTGTYGQYAVPNYLSNRRVNLKLKVDF